MNSEHRVSSRCVFSALFHRNCLRTLIIGQSKRYRKSNIFPSCSSVIFRGRSFHRINGSIHLVCSCGTVSLFPVDQQNSDSSSQIPSRYGLPAGTRLPAAIRISPLNSPQCVRRQLLLLDLPILIICLDCDYLPYST